jgi:broad specificity phosphatase PhoE
MNVIFARHGESEANVLRIISNRGRQHGLTKRGREQARRLAEALARFDVRHLYSSPLLRATETADVVTERLGLDYEVTAALREWDCGVMEGRSDHEAWAAHDAVVHAWLYEDDPTRRIEGGESLEDVADRFTHFVGRLIAAHGQTRDTIALIAHGSLYRCGLPLVVANADETFGLELQLGNTEAVIAELRDHRLVVRHWGPLPRKLP